MIVFAGPSSSVRTRSARIPPRKNDARIDTRYMMEIRLWSTVVAHDMKPWLRLR